jgi:hypothetical protein
MGASDVRSLSITIFVVAVSSAGAGSAAAADPIAEQLFQDAIALIEAEDYASACPKLELSQKREERSGTLLNLAYCHEKLGRTATAWVEYKDAATLARREARAEHEEKALARVAELEPKLSRLRIDVSGDAVVEVDGKHAITGAPFPIDPGEHRVTARAEGRRDWSTRVTIGSDGGLQSVTVPALEAPQQEPPKPPKKPHRRVERDTDEGGIPVWAWVSGGAGLVLSGIAVGFAIDQHAAAKELDTMCGEDRQGCPPDYDFAADYDRERRDFGLFVGLGLTGLAALGVGVGGIVMGTSAKTSAALRLDGVEVRF